MIVVCEGCQTRYLVPDHTLGEGRTVRCTRCAHQWFQEPEDLDAIGIPPELEPIPEEVAPIPEESNLPVPVSEPEEEFFHTEPDVPKERTPIMWAGYGAALGVGLMILGLLIVLREPVATLWPASAGFYEMAGFKISLPGEGLIFDGIKASVAPNDAGVNVLTVQGIIVNLKNKAVPVPPVRASLRAADGRETDSWKVEISEKTAGPQATAPFRTTYPDSGADVRDVNVRFDLPQ